jgi:hypothetical protein
MESTTIDQQIFNAIADEITQVEFQNDQNEFYAKHMDKFEDTEENKLEYTQVYEAYIEILEQMIEAKLGAKFPQEDIDTFYEGFKNNMNTYEQMNRDAVDILFGFLDFDKFKKNILSYKDSIRSDQTTPTQSTEDSSDGETSGNSVLKLFDLLKEDPNDKAFGWKKSLEMKPSKKTPMSLLMH